MDVTKSRINCTIHSVNVSTVLPLAQLMFLSPGRNAVVACLTPDNVLQTLGFSSGGLLMIFSSIASSFLWFESFIPLTLATINGTMMSYHVCVVKRLFFVI